MIVTDGLGFVRTAKRVREWIGQRHRYAHVVRVARFAAQLARAHGVDVDRARTAGLLHDLARLYSNERLLAECTAQAIPIDDFERRHPIVLHAPLGAAIARDEFEIDDDLVLDAIRRHTVAAAVMTPLDCIVFLADGLEPGREFHDRAAMADLALRDLDAAMRTTLHATVAYLRGRELEPAPQSLAALALFAREAHA